MMKEETFKNKILWYNFILCILVVCIHAQNMHIFIDPVTWINRSISFLVEQIACLAVPGFFMCSGYLFYRNLTWKKIPEKLKRRVVSLVIPFFIWNFLYYCLAVPGFFMCSGYLFYRNLTWKKIPEKLKRRVVSLVIPFFIWNFLYYILHLTARKIPYLGQLFDTAVPFSLPEFINAVFFYKYNPVFWFMLYLILFSFLSPVIYGILKQKWIGLIFSLPEFINAVFFYKYNPVFWFMLYLILFSFLSPVIYGILKQKWIGLIVIFAVLILNFSAMLTPYLPINVNDVFSWSIYYLIGSYLGIHWKDAVTSKNPYIPALIFLVGSCISFIFTFVHIQTGWIYIYKICGAAFLWYLICMLPLPEARTWMKNTFLIYAVHQIMALLPLPEARTWMKNTFLIYAVHQIMALFLNKVGNLAFGNSMYIGGFIFLMIPVIVTVFCHYTGNILSKYCPVIWKLISGGRQA